MTATVDRPWLARYEAGGMAATLAGEPVFRYGLEPRSVVAAATPALFSVWKTWIDANWKPAAN